MTIPLLIDGTDLQALGCVVTRWEGDLAPAIDRPASLPLGGRVGERVSGADPVVAPRTLTVYVTLYADTPAGIESVRDAVLACAAGITSRTARGPRSGAVTLVIGGMSGRQLTAYLASPTHGDRGAAALVPDACYVDLALVFVALDPLAYDATATTHVLSSTPARCAVGNAPSRPVITLTGPFTSRVVTLVDGADATQGTFTITGAVLTGETVVVDGDEESVQHVVAGVATAVSTWMTAGDFFTLEPADVVAGVAPGVKLDAGAGAITYRRAWP